MSSSLFFLMVISTMSFPSFSSSSSFSKNQRVYIVHLGEETHSSQHRKTTQQQLEETHISYISTVKNTKEEAISSLLYSYSHSFHGFAATLSPAQAASLSEMEGVVKIWRSEPGKYALHTTRSWEFSGLFSHGVQGDGGGGTAKRLLRKAGYGKDVVVGLLDTGVWPESESFNDEGMGDVPKSWRGVCQSGINFNSSHCNRKVIGARYYLKGYEEFYGRVNGTLDVASPRDMDGHGTHTASTVGGRPVPHASATGGFAEGTARGGVPLSRLAIYKACWPIPGAPKADGNTCFEEDMLAAMEDAIKDGVHVLSVSVGTSSPIPFSSDAIASAALHALLHGIVVVCSAGNSGPSPATLSNPAPWILTVAASSVDRRFPAPVFLADGTLFQGETVTPHKMEGYHPLVYAGQVVADHLENTSTAGKCMPGSLSRKKTKGKIVVCMRGNGTSVGKGIEAKRAGAVGFILGDSIANGDQLPLDPHVLPATAVVAEDAAKLMKYISSANAPPTATIVRAETTLSSKAAPSMAGFSSRGPNLIDPHILKPDVTAPGLNILAAWTGGDSPSRLDMDKRRVKYNIFSGTSMSCPHVAAAAAILRAIYPHWSSAAIRSAIITTATTRNNKGLPIEDATGKVADPFQYGAGHFRPSAMADPGLVYDASYSDYILHLCSLGSENVAVLLKCPKKLPKAWDLNYPSVSVSNMEGRKVMVRRSVRNVGEGRSVYAVKVVPPTGYSVRIFPKVLSFDFSGEEKRFMVRVMRKGGRGGDNGGREVYSFGWFCWSDGVHNVTSPMVIST